LGWTEVMTALTLAFFSETLGATFLPAFLTVFLGALETFLTTFLLLGAAFLPTVFLGAMIAKKKETSM